MTKFEYLGMTVTNKNYLHKNIKSILIWGNGCYYPVQELQSSIFLSKNVKIKIHKNIIHLLCYMGLELNKSPWQKKRLSVFDTMVLRTFGPPRELKWKWNQMMWQVIRTALYFGDTQFKSQPRDWLSWCRSFFHGRLQFLQSNAKIAA